MIRPESFDYNPQTAATNTLQQVPSDAQRDVSARDVLQPPRSDAQHGTAAGKADFERLVRALRSEGVSVCVAADTPEPPKPDAVFPNNWVSFHEDGTVVLYPMLAPNRRRERRREVIDAVCGKLGFKASRTVDLTQHENDGRALEGTGSLVLDHLNRVAYASLSLRTDRAVVEEWSQELGYEPVVFAARGRDGVPLYHTNVLMSIGQQVVVVGSECIDERDRGPVLERLRASGREIIEIAANEVERFAGNILELASWDEALGDIRLMVMSATARSAFSASAYERLSACTDAVIAVPVPTIERVGGGSVRCMVAEVFL